ncbi:MAG: ATP-binding cassette domain-containing protein [Caldithrix sp.]|nr:ATP-binding cassette domain-containing protein [Caldithrix sp.]
MSVGFIFIIIGNSIGIINPKIVQRAIDYLQKDISVSQLLVYAGLIVAVSIVHGIFRFLMRHTIIVVSRLIEYDMRNDLFAKLQSLSSAFYQRNRTGDIMARLTNDLNAVRSVLGPGLMYTVNTLTTLLFVFTMMITISPKLTLIALIPVPVMIILVNRFSKQIHKRYSAVQAQFARISTKVQEHLSGVRIVKSYVLEHSEIDDFNRLNEDYIDKNMHYVKIQAAFRPLMMLIAGGGVALILLFGGRLIVEGVITLGEFVAFDLYLSMLIWPSIALGWVLNIFYQGKASMQRLDYILSQEPDIVDHDQVRDVKTIEGDLVFKNLTFQYERHSPPALNDVHFDATQGKIIAVVGRTGSGKTTLLNLIPRVVDPDRGQIFLDGYDIHDIPIKVLRQHIGYIPQDTFLFSDTIAENIAFGINNVSPEQIERAARIAQIHASIVEFPKGYETILGERGINLSGGQKQRIAIARAILKEPRILLLDDALSAVDTVTEEMILKNLKEEMQGKTCLWVSHRISAIKDADFIIVLEEGKIVEQGTHFTLIEDNGIYADLFEKQKLEESLNLVS